MHSILAKKIILLVSSAFVLASCNGWVIQPLPQPTPFLPPTQTPSIYSPTPLIIGVASASFTPAASTPTMTPTFLPTSTSLPPASLTETVVDTSTPTSAVSVSALNIVILGCNTGIDITHGMGEVTNAFVMLKNTGNVELTNLTATLYALDEGREHPDKIREVASLPVGYQVTIQLTVDSTYNQDSPLQVEVNSDQGLFPREGAAACRDLGLFAPLPDGLNTPAPSQP